MEPDYDNPALRLSLLFTGAGDVADKSPDEMDAEELKRYLSANGENPAKSRPVFDAFRARLSKKQALRSAGARRASILSAASSAGETVAALLVRAQAAVDALMERDPAGAQVYASKFETADADDIATLLDDMLKLEIMKTDDVSHAADDREEP